MAKLYADEQFPLAVVKLLQKMGHDIIRVQDVGKAGLKIPDLEVLNLATEENRAILTLNRTDFIKLHYRHPNHSGIIVCRDDRNWERMATRINEEISDFSSLKGKLIRVKRSK